MEEKTKVTVLLPAYNEEKSIIPLFNKLLKLASNAFFDLNVLVIDDGSKDRTAEMISRYVEAFPFIHLHRHPYNRGLGAAIETGFTLIIDGHIPTDIVVTMDADNTHDPALIRSMIRKINEGSDLVIASRFVLGGKELGLSLQRKILSRGASFFLRSVFGVRGVTDYSCGYRAYRASLIKEGWEKYDQRLITTSGFDCMAEVLIKLARLSSRVTEVPMTLHYNRKIEPSKMKIVSTVLNYFRLLRLRIIP